MLDRFSYPDGDVAQQRGVREDRRVIEVAQRGCAGLSHLEWRGTIRHEASDSEHSDMGSHPPLSHAGSQSNDEQKDLLMTHCESPVTSSLRAQAHWNINIQLVTFLCLGLGPKMTD